MSVGNRTKKNAPSNCPYCAGMRVNHTNCLWTTHPDTAKLLADSSVGYRVTSNNKEKFAFICEHCRNKTKKLNINQVVRQGLPCPICSDGISYPEKFMCYALIQTGIKFETQKTFAWSKKIKNEDGDYENCRRYDFYIPSINCIVENHGEQHYKDSFKHSKNGSLEYQKNNDELKERIARKNGIENYIIIDCRRSDPDFIKNNILLSNLSLFLDFDNINWEKCHQYACSSYVKTACKLWSDGTNNTKQIARIMNIDFSTVIKYLKQGSRLGWCDYDSKEVMRNNGLIRRKSVIQLDLDGMIINRFESIADASRYLNISEGNISSVCSGRTQKTGGFRWMYKEDYEKYIAQQAAR